MVVLKVRNDDENSREIICKLGGINITETVLADKNVAKDYENHEAWLLEKNKIPFEKFRLYPTMKRENKELNQKARN